MDRTVKISRESMHWITGDANYAMKCYEMEQSTKYKKLLKRRAKQRRGKGLNFKKYISYIGTLCVFLSW